MSCVRHNNSSRPPIVRIARTTATVSSKLNQKNGSLSWQIKTNVTPEPIEILVDCGSEITVIADGVLKKNISKTRPIYQISGILGNEHTALTKGQVIATFTTEEKYNWISEVQIVDSKCTGRYDGLLGIDFLRKYNAIIDFGRGIITLQVPEQDIPKTKNTSQKETLQRAQNISENLQTTNVTSTSNVNSSTNETCTNLQSESDQLTSNLSSCPANTSATFDVNSQIIGGTRKKQNRVSDQIKKPVQQNQSNTSSSASSNINDPPSLEEKAKLNVQHVKETTSCPPLGVQFIKDAFKEAEIDLGIPIEQLSEEQQHDIECSIIRSREEDFNKELHRRAEIRKCVIDTQGKSQPNIIDALIKLKYVDTTPAQPVRSIATLDNCQVTEEEEPEEIDTDSMEEYFDSHIFHEDDTETTKLHKITLHHLTITHEAAQFVKYFDQHEVPQGKLINFLHQEPPLSRADFILNNIWTLINTCSSKRSPENSNTNFM